MDSLWYIYFVYSVTFIDRGIPFDPLKQEDPDTSLELKDREIGGLGIFPVKKTTDAISYLYRDGKNVLCLKKQDKGGVRNMKKTLRILVLFCLAATALTASAYAQTVEPVMPETLKSLVAGKTLLAIMEGYSSDAEMEHATLFFQICEQEHYRREEVEALAAGDVILVGGEAFAIREAERNEYGYVLTGEWYTIFLYENDEGMYYAVTDTEHRFYKKAFAIEAPAQSDLRFRDWSDPEADAPLELTLKDLLTRYANEDIHSMPDNTEITFDEEGRLVEFMYRYTPWN